MKDKPPISKPKLNPQQITSVEKRIRPHIRRTPIVEVNGADFALDPMKLIFKLEFMQHSGSFKARGAFANLLTRKIPAAGVAAASGGNHGAAVAFAAMKLGVPAKIFVPSVASPEKMNRIRAYGAELVVTGERYVDALAASEEWIAKSGAMAVHAYDQIETALGQGTVGLEFEKQYPKLDTLLVSVGGGGLIGGIAAWYGGRVKIVGVEPETAATLASALAAGKPVDVDIAADGIAADSLGARRTGSLVFPVIKKYVDRVAVVPDHFIQKGQELLWNILRMAVEPGGAAAFAALLSGHYRPQPGERVGVLLCGGNTTAVKFK